MPPPDIQPSMPGPTPGPTARPAPAPRSARALVVSALWIALYLVLLDVGVNVLFAYPTDPRDINPTRLEQYFEYGRSVEGKLARMTRGADADSAPILTAGWLDGARGIADVVEPDAAHRPVVTFYGMSHAQLLAKEVAEQDRTLAIRNVTAPLGVPTWAFAAFGRDHERVRSDVVILTLMTNTIPLLSTTSGGTMYFDGAYPYTYPRYTVENGALKADPPPFTSLEGYREAFYDRSRWTAYLDWLARVDKYFDPLLFRGTALDKSALVRLLRRSYAITARGALIAQVYDDARGFNPAAEEVRVLDALLGEFGRLAREDGAVPLVFIVNNVNTGDHAFRLLQPMLAKHGIAYLSSHQVVPPNDPRNYDATSHFVPEKNRELAQVMAQLIHRAIDRR
jgi:hypothetical protein